MGEFVVPVTSGIIVTIIVALVGLLWRHRRIPMGMSQRVTRRNYLSKILAMSRDEKVDRLEAVVPNLAPARDSPILSEIQQAWERVNEHHRVRIVTREEVNPLTAAAELLDRGIEVRVARELNTDHISYHLFGGTNKYTVLNQRGTRRDRPEKLVDRSLSKVFHSHFEQVWSVSTPLESLLAEQLLGAPGDLHDGTDRIRELRTKYQLGPTAERAVLQHLAFRHCAPVIFITGLPGAGKSLIRRTLARKLSALRFQVDEQSDYVYAFVEFLHSLMRFSDGRGSGFFSEPEGAFRVEQEEDLQPALQELVRRVWQNHNQAQITLVEFARADVVAALQTFSEEILAASQVIYVQATDAVRATRLGARGEPPRIKVADQSIHLDVSDNHRLPSTAAKTLYVRDNVERLKALKVLDGRVHLINNDMDGEGRINQELDCFIESVVRPYKAMASATSVKRPELIAP